ncbi:MAG: NCS2 family permease [Metamycoplasmataceae bacterium]
MNFIKTYFKFDKRNATFKKEIIGGISTFLAMAYILAVNPSIVGDSLINPELPWSPENTAAQFSAGLFLATAISAFFATMLMGLWANIPIGLAPGMGLNAFFAYTVSQSIGFNGALTVTIISGFVYFFVVITPARDFITKKIPANLKLSIGAALGFFIAYLGMQSSGIIQGSSSTMTTLGDFSNGLVILSTFMLFLGLILHYLKVPGGILISMIVGAILLIILLNTKAIDNIAPGHSLIGSYGDFATFKQVVQGGWLGFGEVEVWKSPMTYLAIFSFVYLDFFDTTGTLMSLNRMIKLDESDANWINKANKVDAVGTIIGAGIGATTVTSFVESTVGVSAGAKTGFSSIITSLMFGLSIVMWPILQVFMPVPVLNGESLTFYQPIIGPILIIVGTLMISQLKHFEWEITIDIPMLFLTIMFMMLTNSIAEGMAAGAITFLVMNLFGGLVQKLFKNKKDIIETMEIQFNTDNQEKKKQELNYLKRINWVIVLIAVFSISFIIIGLFI